MTTLTQAQATAAKLCLKILTDAGLIGENLVTKMRDAQQAIGECLPKMYAACREVEADTGKNMFLVSEVVVQMFARSKWADHDAMMDRVEALLAAFVDAVPAEQAPAVGAEVALIDGRIGTVQGVDVNGVKVRMNCDTYSITTSAKNMVELAVTEQPTPTPAKPCPTMGAECRGCPDCGPVMGNATYREMEQGLREEVEAASPISIQRTPEMTALARTTKEGLINRITMLAGQLQDNPNLDQWLIMSPLMTVAYERGAGGLRAADNMATAAGYEKKEAAEFWAGPQHVVIQRAVAIGINLRASQEALAKINQYLGEEE